MEKRDQVSEIDLSTSEAIKYLQKKIQPEFWIDRTDPLRESYGRLVFETLNQPFDSTEYFLRNYPFDSINKQLKMVSVLKSSEEKVPISDSLSKSITGETVIVVADTLTRSDSDFLNYKYTYQNDSTRAAVRSLLLYLEARDSTVINFTGRGDVIIPVWLNSRSDRMHRYWLKNDMNDSVTVWIGPHSKNTIGLYLENGVSFRRPVRQGYTSDAKIEIQEIDRSKLLDVRRIIVLN